GNSVFIGEGAGANDDFTNNFNVAVGDSALFNNTNGSHNVANGYKALFKCTSWYNTANGSFALYSNTVGEGNVASGYQALYSNTQGYRNVANGTHALHSNTIGGYNVAYGYSSLYDNTTGHNNVANGSQALMSNTTGNGNVANGSQALKSNTTGNYNTAIGSFADVADTALTNATAIGAYAYVSQSNSMVLGSINGVNTATADTKVGIGTTAPAAKLHVVGRTRIDGDRLEFVNTGHSVYIGEGAGASDGFSDNRNVAIGDSALFYNTEGFGNVANGYQALYYNNGDYNVGNGYRALLRNTTGNYNIANGVEALPNNTSGFKNVAVGGSALFYNITGFYNTANGFEALHSNTTGSYNTAIGYNADVSAASLTNATAIGANATVSLSNSLVLGNNANVGIGTSVPTNKLDVNGKIRMRTGGTSGYIPVSDANGVMTWTDPATITAGDDLGNHTATSNLKMSGKWLSHGGDNEGVFVDANGKVGIGGNNPNELLEVMGHACLNREDPYLTFIDQTGADGHRKSMIKNHFSSYKGPTTFPPTANSSTSWHQRMEFCVSDNYSGTTNSVLVLRGDGSAEFNGSVGILTTSPATRLHVLGGVDASLTGNGFIVTGPISGTNICIDDNEIMARNNSGAAKLYIQSGSGDLVMCDNGGQVGIGTNTPTRAQLEVIGSESTSLGGYSYFWWNGAGFQFGSYPNSAPTKEYSIYADKCIAGLEFHAHSDARIKNIKGLSDASIDLNTLMNIEITDYTMKDEVAKGNGPNKKVIAQQVKEVYPQAVNDKITEVVPDIYQKAKVKADWIMLTTDLQAGERVKLITENASDIYEVLEVKEHGFRVALSRDTDKVFVYGREVDDFHTVDYEAISMLNVSATQEQQRIIEAQQTEIEALKAKAGEVDVLKAANIEMKAENKEMKAEIDNIKSVLGIDSEMAKSK
ncbi:MAG: hypothetical protein GY746_07660, partial [Gammaproteobacteria bacterium]|nr:hypothetical protein [Gammaproteobacteria bacterium]